jgi:hypothetical protein
MLHGFIYSYYRYNFKHSLLLIGIINDRMVNECGTIGEMKEPVPMPVYVP